MSAGFVKLYGSILTSSVWVESHGTRLVWITMLALADKNGEVSAAVPGLANIAHVSLEEAMEAIRVLSAPDIHSRTEEHDGCRIEKIDGGWRILNHRKYRDLRTEEAERKAAYRERTKSGDTVPDSLGTSGDCPIEADAEAEEEADKRPSTPTAREDLEKGTPLTRILSVLAIPADRTRNWTALVSGMAEGLGTGGMKPVAWDVLLEAAMELSTAGGTYSAHRYKTFVSKVIERRGREAEPKARKQYGVEDQPRKREPYRASESEKPHDPVKIGEMMDAYKSLAKSPEKARRQS